VPPLDGIRTDSGDPGQPMSVPDLPTPDVDPPRLGEGTKRGRLVLVGARSRLQRLTGILDQRPWSSLPIVGYVDLSGRGRQLAVHPASDPIPVLGRIDDLRELVRRSGATHVLVAMSERPARRHRPRLAGLAGDRLRVDWIDDKSIRHAIPPHRRLQPDRRPRHGLSLGRRAKRLLDIIAAASALLVLSPFLLFIAALIAFKSGWPIFYKQERVGQGGRTFRMIKFRSMKRDAEGATGPIWAANHDERCTPLGDWLRSTCIDELPQIWNILTGEMSLVGPRPERPVFVDQFRGEIADYDLRHSVPGGLTGWAQVHGWRGRTSLRKRLQFDLDYIGRWTFFLDLQILFMTVLHVAFGKVDWGKRRIEREITDALGRDTHLQPAGPATNVPVEP
jgi:undecaprenyl-phosphate glucose phosphotransferase